MVSSDWGDWLPTAIDEARPEGVMIWYLGCNGFVLKDREGTTLFIDPYLGTGRPPRTIRMIPVPFDPVDIDHADAILATHEHSDHVHGASQAPILETTGARLIGPGASVDVALEEESWTANWDVTTDQFERISEGDSFDIGAFDITVGPAHDPDAVDPVSYIIEHPAGTFFHGGDTKPTEEFDATGDRYDIDLAVVAFGSVGNLGPSPDERSRTRWYCDENDAIEIANALQTTRLLPSHWDMWKGMRAEPTALHHHANSWSYPEQLEIVEIGDRITL